MRQEETQMTPKGQKTTTKGTPKKQSHEIKI